MPHGTKSCGFFHCAHKALVATALIGMTVLTAKKLLRTVSNKRRDAAIRSALASHKKDTVYLYMFPRNHIGQSLSRPCIKVEAFLRIHKIPYQTVICLGGDISPTERLPCVAYNGEFVADSDFIVRQLTEWFNLSSSSDELSESEQAQAVLIQRMSADNKLTMASDRYVVVDNTDRFFEAARAHIFFPDNLLGRLLFARVKTNMRGLYINGLNTSGYGDYTDAQYKLLWLEDVRVLEQLLRLPLSPGGGSPNNNNSKKYFVGKTKPHYADICVFAALLWTFHPINDGAEAVQFVQRSAPLMRFMATMEEEVFPDWKELAKDENRLKE